MGSVPLIPAELATICIESFSHGIFFTLSVVSFYLLFRRQKDLGAYGGQKQSDSTSRTRKSIRVFLLAAVLIYLSNTVHWIVAITRLFKAFVYYKGGSAPSDFYGDVSQPTELIQTSALAFTATINDAMIICRLWIVWTFNKEVVIFPVCTLVGLTVCGIGSIYQMSKTHIGEDVFISALGRWLTSGAVLTLCTNVYCKTMIAWRIWRINSVVSGYRRGSLTSVMAIIVESAALYTIWTIFFMVAYLARSNLQFLTSETWVFVAGISFMLINVRVGMGWAQNGTTTISTFEAASGTSASGDQSFAMRPLAVTITSTVHRDHEFDDAPVKSFSHESSTFVSDA